jgi:hypothetical protein
VHARGLGPRRAVTVLAIAHPRVLPSAPNYSVGARGEMISRLDSPACTYPCQRFTLVLTDADA